MSWENPDPQLSSPLFNGRIPPEIRTMVFELALTETYSPPACNFCVRHDHEPTNDEHDEDYEDDKPGDILPHDLYLAYEAPGSISTSLLRTCRRVYLETAHFPAQQAEISWGCTALESAQRAREGGPLDCMRQTLARLNERVPRHAAMRLRRIRVFVPAYWLESRLTHLTRKSFLASCGPAGLVPEIRLLDNVTTFRLTIRSTDWWWWRMPDQPLGIDPFRSEMPKVFGQGAPAMLTAMHHQSRPLLARPSSWAMAFSMMRHLRTLTIDFETDQHKYHQLEQIVAWAVTAWQFLVFTNPPLPDVVLDGEQGTWCVPGISRRGKMHDMYRIRPGDPEMKTADGNLVRRIFLTAEGNTVRKMSWRGLPWHWGDSCHECMTAGWGNSSACESCTRQEELKGRGKGPRLYAWTVTWTAKPEIDRARRTADTTESHTADETPVLPARTREEQRERYNYTLVP